MKQKQFEEILESRITQIRKTLVSKAKEYATDEDQLHNFKVAAAIKDESASEALWGIAVKHLVSVIDLVEGNTKVTEYLVNEKIGDMINYLILLEAIFMEDLTRKWEGI